MKPTFLGLWLIFLTLFAAHLQAQSMLAEQRFEHLDVTIFSEHSTVSAGMTSTIALRLRHDPHWHTYWKYPGDSGLPSKLKLRIGTGQLVATELYWPTPEPLEVGGIHNVGYEGELWLLADFTVPSDAQDALAIAAELTWLVCKEECIPGKGEFALQLPIAAQEVVAQAHRELFAKARDALPKAAPLDWRASFAVDGAQVRFALRGDLAMFSEATSVALFVGSDALAAIKAAPVQVSAQMLSTVRAKHEAFTEVPKTLELVWVMQTESGARVGFQTTAQQDATLITANSTATNALSPAAQSLSITLPLALLLAFFGGLILNLMPCVLPVLSLKVVGLLEAGPATMRAHGVYYGIGVISSFLALGALLLSLRSAGFALGWGFQLQSPALVASLSLLLFALALSMSGLVHFGYGLAGLGQNLANPNQGHARSAFFSGVLACVVASPCTAPMMGTALGYALVQPAWISLTVLATLGLGLAAPMLLLAALPRLARYIPKPGAWMQKFKQALALPMYLSAIWLGWVLAQQRGVDAFALLLVAAVLLALGLVWLEQLRFSEQLWGRRCAVLLALTASIPLFYALQAPKAASTVDWQNYSAERLQNLRERREPVLVQMTAAWCVTCKINERVAMSGTEFADSLSKKGVVALKGDWTHQDAAITSYLRSYGASGVPLVVLYARDGKPEVLPQVLTPAIVEAALVRAAALSSKPTSLAQ
jgi:thiol:disulfide interchange protein